MCFHSFFKNSSQYFLSNSLFAIRIKLLLLFKESSNQASLIESSITGKSYLVAATTIIGLLNFSNSFKKIGG